MSIITVMRIMHGIKKRTCRIIACVLAAEIRRMRRYTREHDYVVYVKANSFRDLIVIRGNGKVVVLYVYNACSLLETVFKMCNGTWQRDCVCRALCLQNMHRIIVHIKCNTKY